MTESTRRNFARTGFLTALSYSRVLGPMTWRPHRLHRSRHRGEGP